MSYTKEDVRRYHSLPRPGKIEVMTSKKAVSQDDLTLAYSPGVADACRDIVADPSMAEKLTGRGNLVAVVTNGTAVLGLGNIGPLAGKPVMEGKSMLFKLFADVDAFDIELDCSDPERLIDIVKSLEPTFGGINLEDIRGPECFHIEEELKKAMNIPVFHDDQHGTAVITGAALMNASRITGRAIADMKVVVMGAGAAGMACARFYAAMGVKPENISMFDIKGLIHKGRTDLSDVQMTFAHILNITNKVAHYASQNCNKRWSRCEDFCYWDGTLHELAGKTIGIVGLGNIGMKVARIAHDFGMDVFAYTSKNSASLPPGIQKTTLDGLFGVSDILTLHCPLTDTTRGLVCEQTIKRMKRGAILINTGRGPLVNEADVAAALREGQLGAYGADVMCQEPPAEDTPLLSAPNAFITPHIAWATYEARVRLMDIAVKNLKSYIAGNPTNVVNK